MITYEITLTVYRDDDNTLLLGSDLVTVGAAMQPSLSAAQADIEATGLRLGSIDYSVDGQRWDFPHPVSGPES